VHRATAVGAEEALRMSASHEGPSERRLAPVVPTEAPDLTAISFTGDFKTFRESWIGLGEREYLQRLLTRHGRNVAAAAREADLDRTYVYRLIRQHAL
jgi:transcriptional regulator of acetoin/glycerol metabolism